MKITIQPGKISGEIAAIPSKSHLHRLLIYAALADRDTLISCAVTEAEDIKATVACLSALGAVIAENEDGFAVTPINRGAVPLGVDEPVYLPCEESGSTLRFMLPVVCALGVRGAFEMKGRLPQRPLEPLDAQLESHGVHLSRSENFLYCEGQLLPGDYNLPGNVTSQYITGLLMALPLLETSSNLFVTAPIESVDYIKMTLDVAEAFGGKPEIIHHNYKESANSRFDSRREVEYKIRSVGIFESPGMVKTEGDWSNGAFWLCAGAMPGGNILVSGLKKDSSQGDRRIFDILTKMGASTSWENEKIRIKSQSRHGIEIDGSDIPDLLPVLAAVAAVGTGTTVFRNASRLRIKESDRLTSTAKTLSSLGANIQETADGLRIEGIDSLKGGTADAFGDHRIAMTAAIASAACNRHVTVTGAQAVNKSYPRFWADLASLGKKVFEE
ncbi:MAG: 3-phosphoshikimate 1-carboxyvinyltransferase [Defluviitaleaceae bacterium]|nr:3-phosphoshikimate 1-carboxyvinyltransferase [Defluviitaleaceae bacterium]